MGTPTRFRQKYLTSKEVKKLGSHFLEPAQI